MKLKTEPTHTPTLNEMKARVIVIQTGIPLINADIKTLGGNRRYGVGDGDGVAILEDYRFHMCQERNRLEQAIAKAEGK